jgi:glutathione S-transferase
MSEGRLFLAQRRYSSWSMRGWLAVALAGLAVEEVVLPLEGPQAAEIKRVSPSGLVPYLEHNGNAVWDSLAIAEYCAEITPGLWPASNPARAWARAIAAEMHAGFRALRQAMPMNLGARFPARVYSADVLADLSRIETIWRETRARYGTDGPFLFGATFTLADAGYAPVVTRILTYEPPIAPQSRAYCEAVRAHPLVEAWYQAAAAEPQAWRIARYENPG